MIVLPVACISFSALYILLMLWYRYGWQKQAHFSLPGHIVPSTSITIIIPARNEAANIRQCLLSIAAQRYPQHLLDVVVVDDHSTDDTAGIASSLGLSFVRVLSLKDCLQPGETIMSYKKKAIETGIRHSAGELIVTTDADCTASPLWLEAIVALYEKQKPAMIVGPVSFTSDNSVVQVFQSVDFMTMQGITAAVHSLRAGAMCNGANLAFTRDVFSRVNGYEGVQHLVSGDDYLLMVKILRQFPGHVAYLKCSEAIVYTSPQPDWRSFLQQRIRWASKSGKYDDKKISLVLVLVYFFNVSLLAILVAGFFNTYTMQLALLLLSIKIIAELFFLYPVARFYNKPKQLLIFPILQPLHIIYIVLAGFLGFVGIYRWKGRTIRQQ